MGWTKSVWRKEVAVSLFEIANIEFQKKIWLRKIPGYQSDFIEVVNNLDGCGIPKYLDGFESDGFLGEVEVTMLKKLSLLLEDVPECKIEEEYKKLWQSELWVKTAALAENIYLDFFETDLIKSGKLFSDWSGDYILPSRKG